MELVQSRSNSSRLTEHGPRKCRHAMIRDGQLCQFIKSVERLKYGPCVSVVWPESILQRADVDARELEQSRSRRQQGAPVNSGQRQVVVLLQFDLREADAMESVPIECLDCSFADQDAEVARVSRTEVLERFGERFLVYSTRTAADVRTQQTSVREAFARKHDVVGRRAIELDRGCH